MPSPKTIRNHVRAELLRQGYSLSRWGNDHGFASGIATKYLSRFAGKKQRPRSGKSLAFVEGLERATGIVICGSKLAQESQEWREKDGREKRAQLSGELLGE